MSAPDDKARPVEEAPPFWGRWTRIYLFVALLLLAQVVVFALLTGWAS